MRRKWLSAILASAILALFAAPASADDLLPSQQNALVQKYCAVCHSDAATNGGLSLEHYDAARPDPPLAAMLLSKLRNGAMGAAGSVFRTKICKRPGSSRPFGRRSALRTGR